ncbi:MAG: hypothetical protein KGN00_01590 [Chloroflexota bacterium]|nr:hypothetical protein [Chloroflexota bacterium]MDE3192356.1 hypothetical protein [Chloroflexota bacterium]
MSWRYDRWSVEHALPVGAASRAEEGASVRAGDVVATGSLVTAVHVADGARRVGVAARDLDRVLRVRPVVDVRKGAILARTGRRFARAATSPIDGRLVHITSDGDMYVSPVVDEWTVRSTIDGTVVRSDAAAVAVEGECWALAGLAGYGPDAIGELALGVDAPDEPLAPGRIDVRLRGRILVGGARMAAEAITRAHACGVSGLVAGAAPAGGLRTVFGDDVDARGRASFDDRPTVLCLVGFGSSPLPAAVWEPLVAFAGARASIHASSARLFVLAPRDDADVSAAAPLLALADDHGSVRPVSPDEDPLPANVLPFDAER